MSLKASWSIRDQSLIRIESSLSRRNDRSPTKLGPCLFLSDRYTSSISYFLRNTILDIFFTYTQSYVDMDILVALVKSCRSSLDSLVAPYYTPITSYYSSSSDVQWSLSNKVALINMAC
ncbi:hypothetical protein NXS19_001425 [Fusarium pseudograminearum]|nr:hypothetical protein NXS19_001425 [Fusarium pseudograminearum]